MLLLHYLLDRLLAELPIYLPFQCVPPQLLNVVLNRLLYLSYLAVEVEVRVFGGWLLTVVIRFLSKKWHRFNLGLGLQFHDHIEYSLFALIRELHIYSDRVAWTQ